LQANLIDAFSEEEPYDEDFLEDEEFDFFEDEDLFVEEGLEEEIELDEEALREILDEEIDLSALTGDEDTEEEEAEAAETKAEEAPPVEESADNGEADLTEDAAEEKAQETDESRTEFSGAGHGTEKKDVKQSKKRFEENRSQAKENRSLLKEQKKLGSKVRLLEEKLDKYGTVILQLKEKLEDSNLGNARLLYQNRVLNSVSLNERQKDRIVEAISNAKSVEEARIVFETLQSAVGSTSKRKRPESLNEVVTRSSSAFIPRKEETKKDSSFANRMRTLAGIPTE